MAPGPSVGAGSMGVGASKCLHASLPHSVPDYIMLESVTQNARAHGKASREVQGTLVFTGKHIYPHIFNNVTDVRRHHGMPKCV